MNRETGERDMKSFVKYGIALGLTACATGLAYAQMKPEAAIRARQSIMRVMALNFGPVSQMAQGKAAFNKDVFTANALRLESVWAMNVGRFFPAGSDKPVEGSKIAAFTRAKPEIWSQPGKFKQAQEGLTQALGKLAAAAKSGDEAAMKTAAGGVGKACKACHDDFQAKD
jgi:cytochrome c556